MNQQDFVNLLENHPNLKKDLFIRGFLITDDKSLNLNEFPFYGNWKVEKHGNFIFAAHPKTGMYVYRNENEDTFFLLGHAYNPFTMQFDENKILSYIAEEFGKKDFFERINDITGVFVFGYITGDAISYIVDPSGMQSACYGKINENFYISSHPQMIGDICGLSMDDFVKEMVAYKWYGRVMGPYLPGDLTAFSEVKRIVPSIEYKYDNEVSHKRFWPLTDIQEAVAPDDYDRVIRFAADILKKNMELVSKKWSNPWISLTGGIDSNTTFAAGNGCYNSFETFSYISAEKEVPDAAAAKRIAEHFGLQHHEFHIPDSNEEIDDYSVIKEVLMHNNGHIADTKDNEIRKRIYLRENATCDVEVKSWVSETIRAYWYKHYGRKSMPKMSPKLYRNLYKIFIANRGLAHKVDKVFEQYIKDFEYDKIPSSYPPADMHYNEVTWGSWGGLNISEMKYCFDITFIYNNRRFFDLMFRVPLEKRISDQHHLDIKKYLNSELYDMNIRVVNMKETDFRAFALNMIFTINSILPF